MIDGHFAVAVVAGLGGMVGWGLADFFAKKTIDEIGDLTTLFWSQLIGIAPMVALFATHHRLPHMTALDPLYLVVFGVVSGLSYLPLYAGFGKGQVSLLSPIFASYAAVVVVLSVFLFGEHVSTSEWIAIAVVFAGVLAISTDFGDLRRLTGTRSATSSSGIREVVSALLVYSVWLVLLDRFIGRRDWVFFVLVIRSASALTLVLYGMVRRRLLRCNERSMWPYLTLIGICDVGAYSAVAYGFSASTNTSVVAVLSSTFSLVTLLLARLFLGERMNRAQQLAALVIVGGIVLVSVH